MVWDIDHLAWWERATRDPRTIRFYGTTRVVDDPELRERIWDRIVQVEKDADKEKQGAAVLVRVDRVRAGIHTVQRRT